MPEKWDKDKSRSDKLLLLYAILLFNNREYTVEELCSEEYLNCSQSSISKIIKALERSGIANISIRRENRKNLYKLDRSQIVPNISLDSEGLTQLVVCLEFLIGVLPDKMQQKIKASLDKAISCVSDKDIQLPSNIGGFIAKGRIDYSNFETIIKNFIIAIKERKICFIRYKALARNEEKEYDFAPKRLLIFHESLYVEGYHVNDRGTVTRKYKDTSKLAIHRVKACSITTRSSATLRDPPRPNNDAFGFIKDEPFEALIRFSPEVASYIEERTWSEQQKIEYDDNNNLLLTVTMNNENECISWVLSFKENAEILEPDWLRKDISQTLLAMRRNYKNK